MNGSISRAEGVGLYLHPTLGRRLDRLAVGLFRLPTPPASTKAADTHASR